MASVVFIIVVIILIFADLSWTEGTNTVVEGTSLMKPVTIGGLMVIQCQIWNMQDDYRVNIYRFHDGRIEPITSGDTYQRSSLESRLFLATRVFPDHTHVYVLTLVDISHGDHGRYICRVEYLSLEESTTIAASTVNVEIYSFPNKIYPACESVPIQPITLYVGNELILTCSSEKGVPTVQLRWSCSHPDLRLLARNTTGKNTVSSRVTLISDTSFLGAMFTCHLLSPGFPNRERTCHIGPIAMHTQAVGNVNVVPPVIAGKGRDQVIKHGTQISGECNNSCSPEDEDIVLYLTISTIGASFLCILFLTTTIILCYKYNSISNEAREARGSVPCNDGSEPVYVSLQRRRDNERNSMYMTLEDPNNPGSKVLMPKEVYEEFYRTLTVKRV